MIDFHPDSPSVPPDATEALEREHEELQALLRDEIGALQAVQDSRFDEIVTLTRRLEAATATRALEAALSRWRLRLQAEGPPRGLPPPHAQAAALRMSPLFDAERYRAALGIALPRKFSAERHYVTTGAFEGLDPGPDFSTRAYYALNADVLEAGWPALVHYVLHGAAKGRPIRPQAMTGSRMDKADLDLVRSAPEFDGTWYAQTYRDVAKLGADPARHYVTLGAGLGRDPGPGFRARTYLEVNPDVASSGIPPFLHYLRYGRAEGRDPVPVPVPPADR